MQTSQDPFNEKNFLLSIDAYLKYPETVHMTLTTSAVAIRALCKIWTARKNWDRQWFAIQIK